MTSAMAGACLTHLRQMRPVVEVRGRATSMVLKRNEKALWELREMGLTVRGKLVKLPQKRLLPQTACNRSSRRGVWRCRRYRRQGYSMLWMTTPRACLLMLRAKGRA